MAYFDTIETLNTLQSAIQAIQWGGKSAFAKVEIYDMTDLAEALNQLMVFGNRVCLIVVDEERYAHERQGRILHIKQTQAVNLILSDRNWRHRQRALIGDVTTPGVLALKALVRDAITGPLVGDVIVAPEFGEPMAIELEKQKQNEGRIAYAMLMELSGGSVRIPLGR